MKATLRKTLRTHRKNLSQDQVQAISKKIVEKLIQLPEFLNSNNIAYYISDENEIDLACLADHAHKLKKSLYLPIFSEKNKLDFYSIHSSTRFLKNKLGIDEPVISNQSAISPQLLDLMLIPLVAFDAQCHRMGRGMGCYDRYLAFVKNVPRDQRPTLMGVAYEFQKVEKLISESWDISMDYVVTEQRIYSCSS